MKKIMELELEKGLKLFFSKNLKQTIIHPLPLFLDCSSTADSQIVFAAFQFVHPMTPKSLNLVKE
jgi:hypothetical protein